ncbi:hypothetical protein BCR44DRAFT_1070425, partial [Catenaria anguillulae PL171]
MATLSFLRDAHQLDQAVSKVKAGSDPSVSWVLTEVIADGDVKLVETGTDLADLCDEFADSKEMFALARLTDPNSHLAKLVLFCWCGEGVPGLRKSRFPQHLDAASAFFSGYHLRIIARDDADVDPVQIMKKMADSSGAKYSVHDQQKTPSQPPKAPVSRPVVANSTPRAVTTHSVTKPAVVSPVVATAKPVIAPKPASNVFAKPAPRAASTFKPTHVTASPSTPYKPAFAPSAAAFQSSTAPSAANAAGPTASSSAGEKSARQLELEAMIKARQEREEQEYQEEMAMRSARRSRENVTVEDAAPATPAVPVPVIPAGMTKSINLGGILSAPTSTATYSPPAPAPAPVAAARPVAQVQPPSPVAASTASTNESSASGGAAGVAAMSAMFSSLAVGSGSKSSSPGTSPRTARKWPTVGSSPSNAPIVNASAAQMEEPAATAAPAPAPAPRPAYVAGSTVAAPVAAAPVAVHRPAEPTPEPIVAAAAPAPVLPPRGNPVYDVEPVAAPEPVVEPTPAPEPAAPLPVDTSLPNLYVAAHPFTASDATELPLQPGDIVAIVESVDGWAVVEHIGTHARGMCPMTYLDRVLDIVMALDRPDAACVAEFEFAGNPAEGELGLRAGMLVVDVAKVDDEWLEGRGYGGEASGYFPASYVRPVADV